MTNKIIKNRDLSKTVIERQSELTDDIVFSDIKDLCCEFGYITNLGFISTSIFKRLPFIEVDFTPYLGTYHAHNGVLLEAFNHKPCLYISDVLVCHRQFNQFTSERYREHEDKIGLFGTSIYALRAFKILVSRKVAEYSIIEQIKESLLSYEKCTLADFILWQLRCIAKEKGLITEAEWLDIFDIFSHFKSQEYKKRLLQIFSDYISIMAIDKTVKIIMDGEVREENKKIDYRSDVETLLQEYCYRFEGGKNECKEGIRDEVTFCVNFELGNLYLRRGEFKKAENELKKALSLEPPDRNIKVNILITLGNVYSQQQKYREAEEALRDALSLNLPNRISIYYALGSNYERQGRLNEAIERFNYMIVNSGSLSIKFAGGAHFHLGCIYKELGKKKEAKHHFEECLKVIPEHKKARENQDALAQAER